MSVWGQGYACVFPENIEQHIWVPECAVWLYHGPKPRERIDSIAEEANTQFYDRDATQTMAQPIEMDEDRTNLNWLRVPGRWQSKIKLKV